MKKQMKVLLVAATSLEIKPLLQTLGHTKPLKDGLHQGIYKNIELDVLITGIGMTATAFYLGKHLSKSHDMAFNAGIAGSFDKSFSLGTVVQIVQDVFADLGIEEGDRVISLQDAGLQSGSAVLINEDLNHSPTLNKLPELKGITVNTVTGTAAGFQKKMQQFKADTESMEGAAFLYACMHEKVPCAQIRSISNYVGIGNKEDWNIPLAVGQLNIKLIEILDELTCL
jgi:futalosine hydrolase